MKLQSALGRSRLNMSPFSKTGSVEALDPRGDLRLIVGEDRVVFQVCSRTLARSSPAWETLLYGPFVEGKAQQKDCGWDIPLPEDGPKEFRILLSAVHGKFEDFPLDAINDSELLRLTVLADKYDMTGSLKPLWTNWVGEADNIAYWATLETFEHLLVCHKLGHGRGFCLAFIDLVARVAMDEDGQLHIPEIIVHSCGIGSGQAPAALSGLGELGVS